MGMHIHPDSDLAVIQANKAIKPDLRGRSCARRFGDGRPPRAARRVREVYPRRLHRTWAGRQREHRHSRRRRGDTPWDVIIIENCLLEGFPLRPQRPSRNFPGPRSDRELRRDLPRGYPSDWKIAGKRKVRSVVIATGITTATSPINSDRHCRYNATGMPSHIVRSPAASGRTAFRSLFALPFQSGIPSRRVPDLHDVTVLAKILLMLGLPTLKIVCDAGVNDPVATFEVILVSVSRHDRYLHTAELPH